MNIGKLGYIALAGLLLLALTGCNEYRVKTVVREDGGGTRTTTFNMDPDQNEVTDLGPDQYAKMFGIGSDGKWKMHVSSPWRRQQTYHCTGAFEWFGGGHVRAAFHRL